MGGILRFSLVSKRPFKKNSFNQTQLLITSSFWSATIRLDSPVITFSY